MKPSRTRLILTLLLTLTFGIDAMNLFATRFPYRLFVQEIGIQESNSTTCYDILSHPETFKRPASTPYFKFVDIDSPALQATDLRAFLTHLITYSCRQLTFKQPPSHTFLTVYRLCTLLYSKVIVFFHIQKKYNFAV
jgi:hypothetical protein